MKLLDPTQVAEKKEKQNDDQLKRIVQLNEAENQAVARMNKAIKEDEEKRATIEVELGVFKAIAADVRANLQKEVSTLEKRKVDALKPIKQLKKEAEIIYKQNVDEQGNLASKRESLEQEQERLSIIAEDLADKASIVEDMKEPLQKREAKVGEAEKVLKTSTDRLSQAWKDHHAKVHEVNADLQQRDQVLKVGMETVVTMRKEIKAEAKRQVDERRSIKDKYDTLERTQQRLSKKKYGKCKKG